jgi:putative integral membrane protein (TIGR02587 family)
MPLLFTMEMWWLGSFISIPKMLTLLGVALVVNFGLAHFAGFKRQSTFRTNLDQTVDAVAVGLVASLVVLLTLNRIKLSDPIESIFGEAIVQALPLSIGASVANAVFSGGKGREGDEQRGPERGPWLETFRNLGITATGAAFIASSIAPTEEIPMLAAGLTYWHQMALIALSLCLTYMIVFVSGFDPRRSGRKDPNRRGPLSETAIAYVVSLVVALVALRLLNQAGFEAPLQAVLVQTLVLGLPAAIGGAAGRLVI